MQPRHVQLWSLWFSYIIRISPTQTEVILYSLNNKWMKEWPGLRERICHLKIDRSPVAWSSKFRGLEIKRVELSNSFLIHSLWAHLYSWAPTLCSQETDQAFSIQTLKAAGAWMALPSPLPRQSRVQDQRSSWSGILTGCRWENNTGVDFTLQQCLQSLNKVRARLCQMLAKENPALKKVRFCVLSISRWWAQTLHVIRLGSFWKRKKMLFHFKGRETKTWIP